MTADLLHLDDDLVVLAKPSGVAVHRGWADDGPFAVDLVRDALGVRVVHPVHRLDRPTSGTLVFARTPEIAAALARSWADGQVSRRYLALTRGIPPRELRVDHPVRDDDGARRPAVTRLGTRWVFRRRYALVECRPETGRTHQIRRHLKHLSCPIIGDTSYGKSEHNRLFANEFGLSRLALHALDLLLPHPRTGAPLAIRCPLPEDLLAPLVAMGCPLESLLTTLAPLGAPSPDDVAALPWEEPP